MKAGGSSLLYRVFFYHLFVPADHSELRSLRKNDPLSHHLPCKPEQECMIPKHAELQNAVDIKAFAALHADSRQFV